MGKHLHIAVVLPSSTAFRDSAAMSCPACQSKRPPPKPPPKLSPPKRQRYWPARAPPSWITDPKSPQYVPPPPPAIYPGEEEILLENVDDQHSERVVGPRHVPKKGGNGPVPVPDWMKHNCAVMQVHGGNIPAAHPIKGRKREREPQAPAQIKDTTLLVVPRGKKRFTMTEEQTFLFRQSEEHRTSNIASSDQPCECPHIVTQTVDLQRALLSTHGNLMLLLKRTSTKRHAGLNISTKYARDESNVVIERSAMP